VYYVCVHACVGVCMHINAVSESFILVCTLILCLDWSDGWMCGIKLQDRVPSKGLRDRLGLDDIILVLQ